MASSFVGRLLTLVGLVYAVYRSFKVLKATNSTNAEATRMLMLWVALAFNALFEQHGEFLISWAPFYFEIKCGILVWMLLPQSSGPGWVFNNLIHPGIRYGRYRAHKDVKPIVTHALTQSKLAAQFALLSSTVSGLGARQLRSVEDALAANVAALDAELTRRASGGTISGAELLAEGPVELPSPPRSSAAPEGQASDAGGGQLREAASPRAAVRARRASAASSTSAGSAQGRAPAEAYAQAGGGAAAMAWLSNTGSALAQAMGVGAAASGGTVEGGGDSVESKKDM